MTGDSINKDLINTQNQLLKTLLSILDLEEVFTILILEEQSLLLMKRIIISILITLTLSKPPILSHGNSGHCLEECNDYYCPQENQLEKKEKEKVKNNISSKK